MKDDSLKPGDLAIVIKSLDGLSVGKIVECVQIDFMNHPEHGTIWLVKSSRQDLVSEFGGVTRDIHMPQSWLKKIPNDPLLDEEDGNEIYGGDLIKKEDLAPV